MVELQKREDLIISNVGSIPDNVKKSNQLIHSKFKLSTLHQKILFLALAKIKIDNNNKMARSQVSVLEIQKYTGLNGHSLYQRVKEAAVNLATLYILNEADGEKFHIQSGIINDVKYDKGILNFEFGQKYIPLISNLQSNYTLLDTKVFMSLDSGFSMRMYEILKSESFRGDIIEKYMSVGDIKLSTGLIAINEKMQKVADKNSNLDMNKLVSEYADKDVNWPFLKKNIDKTIKEMNEKTDLQVSYKTERSGYGGKIHGVTFSVMKKEMLEKLEKKKLKENKINEDELDELVDEVKDIIEEKIKIKECKAILEAAEYDIEKIKKNYEIMKQSKTKIENIIGWLISAVERNDYTEPITREPSKSDNNIEETDTHFIPNTTNNFNKFTQRKYSKEELNEIEKWKLGL